MKLDIEIESMASACAFLCGLALGLVCLKLLGLVSWSWFLVTLPVTFPVLFFAAVGAISFGVVAAFFFVELVCKAATRPTTRKPPL